MKLTQAIADALLRRVADTRIDHHAYVHVIAELKRAYYSVGKTAAPVCRLLTGESRTGKSSAVRELLSLELPPPGVEGEQQIKAIVYAVVPAQATIKSLLEALLRGLGDPHWNKGSIANQTARLHRMLDEVQCRMIILDEFQHLHDGAGTKTLKLVSDWLKVFVEGKRFALIGVGMPQAAAVVNRHPQLFNRFSTELVMPLFNWHDVASRKQFRSMLRAFQKELHPLELPDLSGPELALRMFLASAGRVGLVANVLERAVHDAVEERRIGIELRHLQKAFASAVWFSGAFPVKGGPFGGEFEHLSIPAVAKQVLELAQGELVEDNSARVEVHGGGSPKATVTRTRKPTKAAKRREVEQALCSS